MCRESLIHQKHRFVINLNCLEKETQNVLVTLWSQEPENVGDLDKKIYFSIYIFKNQKTAALKGVNDLT